MTIAIVLTELPSFGACNLTIILLVVKIMIVCGFDLLRDFKGGH